MARTRLIPVADEQGRLLGLVLLSLTLLAPPLAAQPLAHGPLEVARERQWSDLGSDFTRSEAYDLTRPVELQIRVEGLLLPEQGNAELLFSLLRRAGQELALRRGEIYLATLQYAPEARRRGIGKRLRRGQRAVLRGWPASGAEQSPAVLLVEELELPGEARRLRLQDRGRLQRERQQREARPRGG